MNKTEALAKIEELKKYVANEDRPNDYRPNDYRPCLCGNQRCPAYKYSIFGQRGIRYYDIEYGEHFTFY
mgnify:CR=1 FL=1